MSTPKRADQIDRPKDESTEEIFSVPAENDTRLERPHGRETAGEYRAFGSVEFKSIKEIVEPKTKPDRQIGVATLKDIEHITMIPVVSESGHILAVGYDEPSLTAAVNFKKSIYVFADVPLDDGRLLVFGAPRADVSTGSYFNRKIRHLPFKIIVLGVDPAELIEKYFAGIYAASANPPKVDDEHTDRVLKGFFDALGALVNSAAKLIHEAQPKKEGK